jgi:uncharacterized membrane protein YccC
MYTSNMLTQSRLRWAIAFPEAPRLMDALSAARAPLLFGVRLWASVCLALFVAFWLELDNPYWAGTSAAIVCYPQLGASLRKGWFRMIGTVIGATMIVVLTACFPQDRIAFLVLLALWGGICAFFGSLLRNFASYSAALAGYTALIIAADNLGATGGPNADIFLLAVWRASEICIGIACAGMVLAGTDLGGSRRRLALSFAALAAETTSRFTRMLALAGPRLPDTQAERRELVRRVIALDPAIDQTLGESSYLRYRSSILQSAVYGLLRALDGWRGVATHLNRSANVADRHSVETILNCVPLELRSVREPPSPARWLADPVTLRRACEDAVRRLLVLPTDKPSLRLLADETAKMLAGMMRLLEGLALLVDAPGKLPAGHQEFEPPVPDRLPALINAARAVVTIGVVELFWVVTAWPNGASAMLFAAILVLLLSPKGDLAFGGSIAFAIGTGATVICAALIKFAVLPGLDTFPAFCAALALYFIPVGFGVVLARQPAMSAGFTAMAFNFMPLLSPTNQMTFNTVQFYNAALAIVAGCSVAPLAFRLLPLPSSEVRARRLVALTLRDLRRLATASPLPRLQDWEGLIYGRLAALPDQAEALQRGRLLAALSVGAEIIQLRHTAPHLGVAAEFDTVLDSVARGNSVFAVARLRQLDRRLASSPDTGSESPILVRARSRLLVMSEALSEHASYFDAGATA